MTMMTHTRRHHVVRKCSLPDPCSPSPADGTKGCGDGKEDLSATENHNRVVTCHVIAVISTRDITDESSTFSFTDLSADPVRKRGGSISRTQRFALSYSSETHLNSQLNYQTCSLSSLNSSSNHLSNNVRPRLPLPAVRHRRAAGNGPRPMPPKFVFLTGPPPPHPPPLSNPQNLMFRKVSDNASPVPVVSESQFAPRTVDWPCQEKIVLTPLEAPCGPDSDNNHVPIYDDPESDAFFGQIQDYNLDYSTFCESSTMTTSNFLPSQQDAQQQFYNYPQSTSSYSFQVPSNLSAETPPLHAFCNTDSLNVNETNADDFAELDKYLNDPCNMDFNFSDIDVMPITEELSTESTIFNPVVDDEFSTYHQNQGLEDALCQMPTMPPYQPVTTSFEVSASASISTTPPTTTSRFVPIAPRPSPPLSTTNSFPASSPTCSFASTSPGPGPEQSGGPMRRRRRQQPVFASAEEEYRYKRDQNNIASAISRRKRQEKMAAKKDELVGLEARNRELKAQVEEYTNQIGILKDVLYSKLGR